MLEAIQMEYGPVKEQCSCPKLMKLQLDAEIVTGMEH